ncbi:MAG: glycosyltransferase [Thermoleophilaceae bacterium]|nr:glycosyltransferase [Thermoleophilaceae bacterium]
MTAARRAEISVAIATRDRPQALTRCLESLLGSRVSPAEVVVADQSSAADTRAVAAGADRPELPVRWVDGGSDGLAGGQNAAFRHATMPVVAVLDDDCVADAGWIEALERAFAADPRLALVGGRVLPLAAAGDRVFAVASRTSSTRREFGGRSAPWNVGSGNNFAMRREWFDRIGGCDERLGPGTPGQGALDIDLFYRVLRAGGRALYDPGAVVHHEPATRRGRLERRRPYGYGMGAACGMRLREGDLYALRLLGGWLGLRLRVLVSGLLSGRRAALHEEELVLVGTAAGIVHGLRQPPRSGDGLRERRRRGAR